MLKLLTFAKSLPRVDLSLKKLLPIPLIMYKLRFLFFNTIVSLILDNIGILLYFYLLFLFAFRL